MRLHNLVFLANGVAATLNGLLLWSWYKHHKFAYNSKKEIMISSSLLCYNSLMVIHGFLLK